MLTPLTVMFCPLMALSWLNLPCALKAAIGIGKRTLGHPASLPRHRGRSKGLSLSAPPSRGPNGGGRWDVRPMPGSLRLDVCRSDHFAPFLGFVGDELTKIRWRARKHRRAQVG